MLWRERDVGEHVGLGFVEEAGQVRQLGAELICDLAPLSAGGLGIVLGERGGDEGGGDAVAALAGMGQAIAREVDAAPLPAGAEHLATWPLMPSWVSETTSLTPRRPRRASLRRNAVQNVSASDGPISVPRPSRWPSLLTPTATITATDTMRPFWRTLT